VIRAIGGVAPTAERAEAVKLGLEREILATEEELLTLRAQRGVGRHRQAQAELHASAAILAALATRKAKAKQEGRADPCVHQAALAGQLEQSIAMVAQYSGAHQLKRRHRRRLRAAEESRRACEELLERRSEGVAAWVHSEQSRVRREMVAAAEAISRDAGAVAQRKRQVRPRPAPPRHTEHARQA
jgi:hypothetical protein